MNRNRPFTWSDEQLNAFVDGELPPDERAALAARCESDPALRQQVARLQRLRGLVRDAYAQVTPPQRSPARPGRTWPRRWVPALAASLVFAAGLGIGWVARESTAPAGALPEATAAGPAGPAVRAEQGRIVLHVSADARGQGLAALEHAEGLLLAARDSGRPVAIEIVANGSGLDLLRVAASPYAQRIESMRRDHPSLSLVACGVTVQKLRETGADVRLLPGTQVATSALDQIVLRMQQGWAYVRL